MSWTGPGDRGEPTIGIPSARYAYTLSPMVRFLVSLAMALVTVSAPIATQACEATCAARNAPSTSQPVQHHSCHQETASSARASIGDVLLPCGHLDSLPAGLGRPSHVVLPL